VTATSCSRLVATMASAALAVLAAPRLLAQTPVFQSTTSVVSVSASVKRSNAVVANLTTKDFALTDNGVAQVVDAVSIESVPIDVTLFLDTSGSTAGKLDEMEQDVRSIVPLLRPGDRFRLLTIGDSVYTPVPWVAAGTRIDPHLRPVGGISLIRDALVLGLLHKVETGRRHLVVGMTDRQDCGSVVPAPLFLELAARSEAVMHLVDYAGGGGSARYRVRACTPRARADGERLITQAAERTGGELHGQSRFFRASSIVKAFQTIFSDFRQSYVLRYSPSGVSARGWHAIVVRVPGVRDATVRARQGYYAD
jgi:VWFA-related protein